MKNTCQWTQSPMILLADDEQDMRMFVKDTLTKEGCTIVEYNPCKPQPELLQKSYDVVILDIIMPGLNGFDLRKKLLPYSSSAQFIIMTGYPNDQNHLDSLEIGAFSFLVKPFRADHLRYAVRGAMAKRNAVIQKTNNSCNRNGISTGLIGNSRHIHDITRQIYELAPIDLPVLITGESGTGKDLVAKSIHQNSPRKDKPFIAINCGGLTASLIESELFGHIQGAFTGAVRTKHGLFGAAEGGTLFLDEIGELPVELQSKFLRVLDTGEYYQVGNNVSRKANVRIVSATNQDLAEMINKKQFRQDLYYRLSGGLIKLLPLRERSEDVPALVAHFCEANSSFSTGALNVMKQFEWPGNIRELAMVIKTLQGICPNEMITEENVERVLSVHYGQEMSNNILSFRDSKALILQDFESTYFTNLLKLSKDNLTKAAAIAGMDRKNLRDKLKQLNLYKNGSSEFIIHSKDGNVQE